MLKHTFLTFVPFQTFSKSLGKALFCSSLSVPSFVAYPFSASNMVWVVWCWGTCVAYTELWPQPYWIVLEWTEMAIVSQVFSSNTNTWRHKFCFGWMGTSSYSHTPKSWGKLSQKSKSSHSHNSGTNSIFMSRVLERDFSYRFVGQMSTYFWPLVYI